MKNSLNILFLSIPLLSLVGCSSMLGNNNRTVAINSNPSYAEVYYNGSYVGKTPTKITVASPMDANIIRLKKSGYEPQQKPVQSSFQTVGILNVLFWPGFIVDYATGDMKKVNPTLAFNMQKTN